MYKLYHIKGVKWGCTKRTVKRRVWEQGYSIDDVCEIIEIKDINQASELENTLNIQFNYKLDPNKYNERDYSTIAKKAVLTNLQRSRGGQTAGANKVKSGLWDIISKNGRKLGNKISCELQSKKCKAFHKKTNTFIQKFNSISEAAQTLNLHRRAIAMVLSGKRKSTGKYYFTH